MHKQQICGLWHDGEMMIVFFDNDEGFEYAHRVCMLDPFLRNELLADLLSGPIDNTGATAIWAGPLDPRVSGFPERMLCGIGPRWENSNPVFDLTDDDVERIEASLYA